MRSGFCEILTVVFFGHSPTSRSSSGHRVIAGPICEEPFIGTRLPRSEHDDAEAANIGRLICRSASSLDAYLAFADAEAVGLLREHSAAVHRVADCSAPSFPSRSERA